eukprot:597970-Hanusia_phi.AAC.1
MSGRRGRTRYCTSNGGRRRESDRTSELDLGDHVPGSEKSIPGRSARSPGDSGAEPGLAPVRSEAAEGPGPIIRTSGSRELPSSSPKP